jgi:hypothetical protein
MTAREKQTAAIAALTLLVIGTAFAATGKKKKACEPGQHLNDADECVDDLPDVDPDNPVTPPEPKTCPPGQHLAHGPVLQRMGISGRGACVDDRPDPADVDDIIDVVPRGAHFYQVKKGDIFLGTHTSTSSSQGHNIAWMAYRRECFEAAKEFGGLGDEGAWAWVNAIPSSMGQSGKTHDIILCGAFNDACYGTWGYCGTPGIQAGRCRASEVNRAGPHGRAIRLLPQHPDNIARVRAGKVVARYVQLGTPANAGDARSINKSGQKGKFPALWIPKLNRRALWESHGSEIEAADEAWDDSSPVSSPPPWIMRGGEILDYSGTLTLPSAYGCAPGSMTMRAGG